MKLKRVSLQNFRCFGSVDIDLLESSDVSAKPLDVVLLVGGNGSGKTSILKAICAEFTELWSGFGGERQTSRDIRFGTNEARIAIHWQDSLGVQTNASFAVSSTINEEGCLPEVEFDGTNEARRKAWIRAASSPTRRPSGVISSFDVYRLIPPSRIVGPNNQDVVRHRGELALAPTIFPNGQIRPRAQNLKQWIVNLDSLRAKAKADRQQDLPIWGYLHDALNTMLRPYSFDRVDENFDVLFRTPTGHIPLEALSDGFRSVFVIVTELLLRLSLATNDPEQVLTQEATCLVDEIDAHLHPKWQETVIPGLRVMFPNVQFICTTHSEIVVSTVEPKNVFRLEETNGFAAVRQDQRFKAPARTAVSIAEEVFEGHTGTKGRQWIIVPSYETQKTFWSRFKNTIRPGHHVFAAEGPVFIEHLKDLHGRALPGLDARTGRAALFFVDEEPDANWSHTCRYILLHENGEEVVIKHDWPPSEALRLIPASPVG